MVRRAILPSLVVSSLLALSLAGCGEPAPVKKGPSSAIDPAEQAKIDQGRKLIDSAARELNERQYDLARKHLKEAAQLNNESQRFEIEEATDKLDKREAKLWFNETNEKLQDTKGCFEAIKELAVPIKKLESDTFARELRRLVGAEALKCVQAKIDEKVIGVAYADARKFVAQPEVKDVLGSSAWKKVVTELDGTIGEAITGQIAGDLKARKWAQAVEKVDAALKRGDTTEEQAGTLLESIREAVTPEIEALATKSLGQSDAPAAMRQIDQIVKLVKWQVPSAGQATMQGEALPEALAKKYETLSIWVEAQRAGLKIQKKAEMRYAHGKVAVAPPNKHDAPSKRDIPHGSKVWILGTAKGKALVTDVDPGKESLVQILDRVAGWAVMGRLSNEPTIDWLPPDDQLKGERVWGPLRANEPTVELGLVTDVSGRDISVKRLADDVILKLPRAKLRSGRLSPGTRVITFCTAKDQPAKVVEVLPGSRGVSLKCDGGQEKEEVLPSLRSKLELLPTTK